MGYTRTAIVMHWLTALLILAAFAVGYTMTDLPLSPFKLKVFSWHKWIGVTVFLLTVLRLVWRLGHPAPALPDSMKDWEKKLAAAGHGLLYVLMFAVPLTGWLMSSAKGFQVVYFGVLPIPDLIGKDKELGELLEEVHGALAAGLGVLILGHVAAALKHRFMDRDGVMERMLRAK